MEKEEIEQLLINTAKSIYGYLLKIGVNRADVDDIVQDTLNKALITIYDIDTTYIKTWLFQIAINKHRDLIRKRRRIEQFPIESVQLIGLKGLEEIVLNKEIQLEIQEVLNKISPMYKHILLLKYDLELSYKEISVLLEMKEETVKTSLYRARNEFKKIYRR